MTVDQQLIRLSLTAPSLVPGPLDVGFRTVLPEEPDIGQQPVQQIGTDLGN
jgi:hypothetical protein